MSNPPSSILYPRSSILDPLSSIFLIGPRGSGKTTVARLLAEHLGWQWVDADDVLERQAGRIVREVFAEVGEAGFREREAAVVAELCGLKRHVIATGGGVILREDNRHRLREAGHVVWLTADLETLWQRTQNDPSTAERRPALHGGGREEVAEVLRAREALYRACADFAVDTAGKSPGEIVEEILAGVGPRSANRLR